jgi:hypothetical protein
MMIVRYWAQTLSQGQPDSCGIREIVGGVELCAIPQLIQVPVKLVRTGLCDVVDLRRSMPPLIDGIGKRIDRHFRYRIQPEDKVRRESANSLRMWLRLPNG